MNRVSEENERKEAGKLVMRVNPKGTTQRYSQCGTIIRKDLSVRTHDCSACGFTADRDYNASLNIRSLGLNQLSTSGRGWQETLPAESLNVCARFVAPLKETR